MALGGDGTSKEEKAMKIRRPKIGERWNRCLPGGGRAEKGVVG